MPKNQIHSNIVGRDEFIRETWERLERKSLYMNDLRRIGKTQIILKMKASPPDTWLTTFSDLEGTHTAEEFAALVYKESANILNRSKKVMRKMSQILGKAAGTEIMGVLKLPDGQTAPWKDILRATFDDIVDALHELPGHRVAFFWDEVPYMLDNIANSQGKTTAMQVLDILRELSQRHTNIRLLLTGSIGIHHVLRSLWADGYKGSPLNHMDHIQPGPLEKKYANSFAESELTRRKLSSKDPNICSASLAHLTNNVPFYIEKLVARLPKGMNLTPAVIEKELDEELRSDESDWDLDYYRRRVKSMFPQTEPVVLAILDSISASTENSLSFQEIRSLVSAKIIIEEENLREHLKLLCMDHYLVRDDVNSYRFYLSLIGRWWKINRNL